MSVRRLLFAALGLLLVTAIGWPGELSARGRGRGGGISRGGPARGGSIRHGGMGGARGGGYRRAERGGYGSRGGGRPDYRGGWESGSWGERAGTRGAERPSWQGGERPSEAPRRDRAGDGTITRGDEDRKVKIKKTDDGFVAVGARRDEDGGTVGVIRRSEGQTKIRAAQRDGDQVSWAGANCRNGKCVGGGVSVDRDYYRYDPYYYYPYYYGWYSCPYGATTYPGAYGTPVYGCANVVVISTTISMGVAETSSSNAMTAGAAPLWPQEAQVRSRPVLLYAPGGEEGASVYATSDAPEGVYSERSGDRYLWVPGPAEKSDAAVAAIREAGGMEGPSANATVITYEVEERIVYLTNERPIAGYYAREADYLFVWIPGVRAPTQTDERLIERVIAAHREGGQDALDREVRKLEVNREAPPETAAGKG